VRERVSAEVSDFGIARPEFGQLALSFQPSPISFVSPGFLPPSRHSSAPLREVVPAMLNPESWFPLPIDHVPGNENRNPKVAGARELPVLIFQFPVPGIDKRQFWPSRAKPRSQSPNPSITCALATRK
jgi:hypothetical protein